MDINQVNDVIQPNLEEECRAQGKIRQLPNNKCKKKLRKPDTWQRTVARKQRYMSKELPKISKCNHAKKSNLECETLNMQDVRRFNKAFYSTNDKIKQDCFLLKYVVSESPKTSSKRDGIPQRKRTLTNKYYIPRFRHGTGKK